MTEIGGLETLLAIEEIKQLKARYFRYVDTKQWDLLPQRVHRMIARSVSKESFPATFHGMGRSRTSSEVSRSFWAA